MNERLLLIKIIHLFLLPAFEMQGFEVIQLKEEDSRSSEIYTAFPFGQLRRTVHHGFELVEIQLDKYDPPAFRLNVGIVPSKGIVHNSGHIDKEDVWVHYLDNYYLVYQWPMFQKWFSIWHWPGRLITESCYKRLVDSVIKIIPEIEQVFDQRKCGVHVRHVKL